MEPRYIDIHSHLNLPHFDADLLDVVGRMREHEVHTIVIGVDYASSEKAIALSAQFPEVFACVGIHPVDEPRAAFEYSRIEALAADPKVVAIGECGLDYYRGADDEEKARQRDLFDRHIEFACAHDLPLMLHGRPAKHSMDAYIDMLDMLEAASKRHAALRGNAHFFVGDVAIAKRLLSIGFSVSFPGVITFARDYDEVVRYVPLDMLHAETDAPYAAPEPYRGKRNEPAYVVAVVKKIAELKEHDEETVRAVLVENAVRAFNL